jgi:hypothetical protein
MHGCVTRDGTWSGVFTLAAAGLASCTMPVAFHSRPVRYAPALGHRVHVI